VESERTVSLEYAKRQYWWFQAMFQLSLARGKLEAADSYAKHMSECNDCIDRLLRVINNLD
jgi:tRNA A37 N6-isopentenylltransferase MiaA